MIKSEVETFEKDELKKLQSQRLSKLVKRVYQNVEFYKEKFDQLDIKIENIKSIDDIEKLPFTTKKDLRVNYPFGMLATSLDNVVRIHSSSGTTGKPTVVAYTQNDMNTWIEAMGRIFCMGNVTKKDILQNSHGYGLFTGGLGFDDAARALGVSTIPSSTGFSSRQLMLLKDLNVTILGATPSFALHLAQKAKEEGYDFKKDFKLRVGFFGAEPTSKGLRDKIREVWGISYHQVYGLSEIIGPGVAGNCNKSEKLHISEDLFYPEIIDPKTLKVLKEGEIGELVITTLTKEALPFIRYRTGDITSITREKCECGRTSARIDGIKGRSDDMLVVNGVNVFPSQVEHVLSLIDGISLNYVIIAQKKGHLDKLEIDVELDEELISDDIKKLELIKRDLVKAFHEHLYINVNVKLVAPKSLPISEGKAIRVIDKRSENV